MLRTAVLVMCATALLFATGCQKKDADAKRQPAANPSSNEPSANPGDPRAGARGQGSARADELRRDRRARQRLLPITAEEVSGVLALPDTLTTLAAPAKPERGERVRASYCFAGGAAEAAGALAAALEAGGWSQVKQRIKPDIPDRAGLAGQHPPYWLTASVRKIEDPACLGSAGNSQITVTIHKVNPQAMLAPGASPGGLPPAQPRETE